MQRAWWIVVACGAGVLLLATGVRMNFGIFQKPIVSDLQISYGLFGFGAGLAQFLFGVLSPVGGALATRFGVVRTCAAGGVIYVLSLILVAVSQDGGMLTLGNALAGAAIGIAGFSAVFGAVGQAAPPEKRTMALAITTAGGSLGQFSVVPFGHVMMELFGWRGAMLILAALAALMIPLAFGLGRWAGNAPPATGAAPRQTTREAVAEAFGDRGFVLLTIGFFVCGFHVAFVSTHMPNYLISTNTGLDWFGKALTPASVGALSVAVIGFFNIIGTLAAGVLGTRYQRKNVLALNYLMRGALFMFLMLAPPTGINVMIFSTLFGLLYLSTVPLTSGLVGYLFGPQHMGTLYGIAFFSHQIGGFLGAWGGGFLFDRTGGYDAMWWAAVALALFAAAIHWMILERPVARLVARPA
ncbi:MAG: MFS transporter [Rhodospirillales bacterium]|nr:MAG: MFS transporter [Rhodospirillales bacterium]